MNTKIQFLCRRVTKEPAGTNDCLQSINSLVNGWLERNPCNVLDVKYNEVVSYYTNDEWDENYRLPYTEYISVMIIYNDDI